MRSVIQSACVTLILLQVPTYLFMSSGVKIGRSYLCRQHIEM